MKKKTPYILLFIFTWLLAFGLPVDAKRTYKLKISRPSKKIVVDSIRIETAKAVRALQSNCCSSQGCDTSDMPCEKPHCKNVVLTCHTISIDTFNILTSNMSEGSATFTKEQIENVLTGANCAANWIRCYIHNRWLFPDYFRIGQVSGLQPEGLDYETFYSVILLQEIYDQDINSIKLYRGTAIGTGQYVIPFQVNYTNGDTLFYDVSDLFP